MVHFSNCLLENQKLEPITVSFQGIYDMKLRIYIINQHQVELWEILIDEQHLKLTTECGANFLLSLNFFSRISVVQANKGV